MFYVPFKNSDNDLFVYTIIFKYFWLINKQHEIKINILSITFFSSLFTKKIINELMERSLIISYRIDNINMRNY